MTDTNWVEAMKGSIETLISSSSKSPEIVPKVVGGKQIFRICL